MDIVFQTRKLKRLFNSEKLLKKRYGTQLAEKIMVRMSVLKTAKILLIFPASHPQGGIN